jgi:hypothetical protein
LQIVIAYPLLRQTRPSGQRPNEKEEWGEGCLSEEPPAQNDSQKKGNLVVK